MRGSRRTDVMGGADQQRRALLLGLVEVMQPVEHLGEEDRARVFAMCHAASTSGNVEDRSWLGWVERGFMGVEVILDQQHLHITSDDISVSRHNLAELCAIIKVQGNEGHLVFIGQCQVKESRLAVVLDMMSDLDAQQLENDVRERLCQRVPPCTCPSAPQDTKSQGVTPRASPSTSTSNSHTPGNSDSQHAHQTLQHASVSPAPPGISGVGRLALGATGLTKPPPPAKPVLPRAPDSIAPPRWRPPLVSMPDAATLTATPLCLISRSPVLLVATRPVSTSGVSTSAEANHTAVTPSVSSSVVASSPVSTQPVSFPVTSQLSAQTVSTQAGSTPTVSTFTMSSQSVSTPLVSTPRICTTTVSTTTVSNPPVAMRRFYVPAVFTKPMSVPAVSAKPVSTPTISTQTVSTPKVSARPLSFPKAFTPLVAIRPVSTRPVTSTVSTRPVSTPTVSARRVSIPKVLTRLVSLPTASATSVSTSAESTSIVSTIPVSTSTMSTSTGSNNPVTTSVSITLASTTAVTPPATLSSAAPPVSTQSTSVHERRPSIVSSSSQEEESNINEKVELLLGALDVDESQYLYMPGLKPPQEQDSSSSLEQELCSFLENEREYLNILERIAEARKTVTSELHNLLNGSDRLADFHEDLYRDLYQEFPSSRGIVQAFLSRKEELDLYRYYIMNAPQVAVLLGQQPEEVSKQHPTLEADIKSSWKRIHFYFMTFEKLLKIVPAEEQQLVQKLVNLLRETNRQGDSGILIDSVSGAPFSLHTLGTLLLHTLFTIKESSGILSSKTKYHVLLFEEMMVIVLPKKKKYQYKDHLPLRQMNLLPQANSDEAAFIMELVQGGNKKNKKYTFRPRQQEAKDVWVAEISRLHSKYQDEIERLRQLRCGHQ